MRILMKALAAGPNAVRREGEQYDVDAAEGQALIDGGYATLVEEPVAIAAPVDETPTVAAAPIIEPAPVVPTPDPVPAPKE